MLPELKTIWQKYVGKYRIIKIYLKICDNKIIYKSIYCLPCNWHQVCWQSWKLLTDNYMRIYQNIRTEKYQTICLQAKYTYHRNRRYLQQHSTKLPRWEYILTTNQSEPGRPGSNQASLRTFRGGLISFRSDPGVINISVNRILVCPHPNQIYFSHLCSEKRHKSESDCSPGQKSIWEPWRWRLSPPLRPKYCPLRISCPSRRPSMKTSRPSRPPFLMRSSAPTRTCLSLKGILTSGRLRPGSGKTCFLQFFHWSIFLFSVQKIFYRLG